MLSDTKENLLTVLVWKASVDTGSIPEEERNINGLHLISKSYGPICRAFLAVSVTSK